MHILVINSGSSSVKFSIFAADDDETRSLYEGEAGGLGTPEATLRFADASGTDRTAGRRLRPGAETGEASHAIADLVTRAGMPGVDAVGYRVVHTGPRVQQHGRVTPELLEELRKAVEFAPLHEPPAIRIIEEMQGRFPSVPHFACFDTVFHETMPEEAKTYGLPDAVRERGVRRYGFHGLSCESVVAQLREAGGRGELVFPARLIVAHLGSGCSVTAIQDGESVDTSMGLTPDGGVVMGTRPGDLDPGVVLYLLRQQRGDREQAVAAVEVMLNRDAGMHALSGLPNDVKRVRAAAKGGDVRARLALAVFTRSVTKAIGGYVALIGGVDAVVFTGGIGEHDAASRREIVAGMKAFGLKLEERRNLEEGNGLRQISSDDASATLYVVPAEEDLMIARHVFAMDRGKL